LAALDSEHKKAEVDLSDAAEDQLLAIKTFITTADEILKTVKESFSNGIWSDAANLPSSPMQFVADLASRLETRAREEEGADDPKARTMLESERNELVAREWLGKARAEVHTQIVRYQKIDLLGQCQKDTATASITAKNSELTAQLVTKAFCDRF